MQASMTNSSRNLSSDSSTSPLEATLTEASYE
jgi:hypothetical protein